MRKKRYRKICIMEFRYTVDPGADEPIMTLDDQIGQGEDGEEFIDASQFCKELMLLDNRGKKVINVWVNSPGGSVTGGMQIFNTILKIKAKVDTHNVGMAASIAAPIFLAGRNRYMMDNAVLMVHPVSGGDDDSRKVFEGCVNSMISSRSFLTPEIIKGMMDATTWLDAHQCQDMGLCIKESSSDFNKQRAKPDLSNVSNAHRAYKEIVNNALNSLKTNKMTELKSINNKLELNEDAAPSATIKAIDALMNKSKESETKIGKMKSEMEDAENKFNTLKADYDKIVAENKASKEEAETTKATAIEAEAKNAIENAVKIGKIALTKNAVEDGKILDLWKNNYKANPAGTKAMIDAIPLNKKGATLPATKGDNVQNEYMLTMVAASTMSEVRNKFKL